MFEYLINMLVSAVFGSRVESRVQEMISFFIYDSVKILFLIFFMISIMGFLRTFLPGDKVKKWLSERKAWANLFASCFGAVTPFCSCSSIPIFLGFLEASIPLGVTFSFLITSPIINEYLVVLMLGYFGWKITILYVISGISIGVISGLILGRMKLEKDITHEVCPCCASGEEGHCHIPPYSTVKERLRFGAKEALTIIKRLWIWVVIGVGLGALIHNYVPQEAIHKIVSRTGPFSVPLAVLLGVPMYGSCAAIVPIAIVLFRKGIPLGTALAFMMATAALSLPEAVILKRAMKFRLMLIFFTITTLAIIFTGYLFNFLQKLII